jgi:hypothetical protein
VNLSVENRPLKSPIATYKNGDQCSSKNDNVYDEDEATATITKYSICNVGTHASDGENVSMLNEVKATNKHHCNSFWTPL